MDTPSIEALKELLRVMILAALPVIISSIEQGVVDWKSIIVITSLAGLRAVDKYMHQAGKEDDDEALAKGLTRF